MNVYNKRFEAKNPWLRVLLFAYTICTMPNSDFSFNVHFIGCVVCRKMHFPTGYGYRHTILAHSFHIHNTYSHTDSSYRIHLGNQQSQYGFLGWFRFFHLTLIHWLRFRLHNICVFSVAFMNTISICILWNRNAATSSTVDLSLKTLYHFSYL